MRKLIEELQTEIERRDLKEAALEGLFLALQIVKAHDPWISVDELPPRAFNHDGTELYFTDDVIVRGKEKGEICEAFFRYSYNDWCVRVEKHTIKNLYFNPTHWTYLPEVKK